MKFVPVVIPTLNRVNHLSRCIMSLADNYGADNTDLIISLDYPPDEKYFEGYNEVKDFLSEDGWKQKFKSVQVIIQEKNLGPNKNILYLYEIAEKQCDCCIFTEDDNVFSTNFLLYVNKGLGIFKDDERVLGICGRKEVEWKAKKDDTVTASKIFPGYGVGIWFEKEKRLANEAKRLLLKKESFSFDNLMRLRKRNKVLFNKYVLSVLINRKKPFWVDGELAMIDTTRAIYMYYTDHFCIVPITSKSDTRGDDGSGVNMKKENYNLKVHSFPLDRSNVSDIIINGKCIEGQDDYNPNDLIYNSDNDILVEEYMKSVSNWRSDIKALVCAVYLQIR